MNPLLGIAIIGFAVVAATETTTTSLAATAASRFRAVDHLHEAVEPLQPRADALEGVGREDARRSPAAAPGGKPPGRLPIES